METSEARFERWRARGDGAALSDVFDALAPGLLRLAIHLVGDPAAAEDLVQQTFVTAIERAASWDGRRPLEPWLQGILANRARDLKKSARRPHDPDFDLERVLAREEDAPLESASRRELSGELARAVDALEEPYRATVLLRLRHGMEAADIAHVLGRSPGAVRVQLHRARELLRKSLPAGIASALVLLADSARGLETVRNQFLTHAAQLAPTAVVSGGLIGGVLVMKKLVVAVVVLVLAVAAFLVLRLETDFRVDSAVTTRAPPEIERPADTPVIESPPLVADERRAGTVEHVEVAATQDEILGGIVIDAATNAPIAGARVALHAPVAMPMSEIRSRYWDRVQIGEWETRSDFPWPFFDDPTSAQEAGLEDVLVSASPDHAATPIDEATTNAEGRFELSASSTAGFVVCEAVGYVERGFATRADRGPGVDATSDRTVRMARNGVMRGRIVAMDGSPIRASIGLSLYGNTPKMLYHQGCPALENNDRRIVFHTDDEGRYEVEHDIALGFARSLDARWTVEEVARPTPYGIAWRRTIWADLADETGDVDFVLAPTSSILVRDAETREPVVEAHIEVFTAAAHRCVRSSWAHLHDGRLALTPDRWTRQAEPDIPYGAETECRVWALGYAPAVVRIPSLLAPGVVELDLVRATTARIVGRVHRGAIAAAGARVLAFGTQVFSDSPIAGALADEEGRFAITVPDGNYALDVEHDGVKVRRSFDAPLVGEIDVDLAETATLVARFTNALGEAMSSRRMRIRDSQGDTQTVTSDGQGVARIERVPPGPCEISVSHRRSETVFVTGETRTLQLVPGTNEAAFVVPDVEPRYARLVVEDGPIAGWIVCRSRYESRPFDIEPDGRIPLDFSQERSFVLDSPAGTRQWIVMPEDAVDGAEVRVRVGGAGYRGRIIDATSGQPLHSMGLWFGSSGDGVRSTAMVVSDPDGRFEVRGLAITQRSVRTVPGPGCPTHSGDVRFDLARVSADPPVELLLRRPSFDTGVYAGYPTATLEAHFQKDAPVLRDASAYVSVAAPGDEYVTWMAHRARVGVEGKFRVQLPAVGEWTLGVWEGTDHPKKVVADTWRPSGADPEVREFTLLP